MQATTNAFVTKDDILIRPWFTDEGDLKGFFADFAIGFPDQPFTADDVQPTPQMALERFLKEQWPEVAATAFARHWIANRPGGYNNKYDCLELFSLLVELFPGMGDNTGRIVGRCEAEWTKQQRENNR